MKRTLPYNTKQREAIFAYIHSLGGDHVTAAQIVEHFAGSSPSVGRATVYRHLERLTESGHLRRFAMDGTGGACYQQADGCQDDPEHFHLKCEQCGTLYHLRCDTLQSLRQHMFDNHMFRVNEQKTVLYGTCEPCLQDGQKGGSL